MLKIVRSGENFTIKKKTPQGVRLFTGDRSLVYLPPLGTLHAIERGDGFVRLPVGVYDCEMGFLKTKAGSEVRALRFLERKSGPGDLTEKQASSLKAGRFYIHGGTRPWHAQGCVVLGLLPDEGGVVGSGDAMRLVFDALGGWTEGLKFNTKIEERGTKSS